MFFLRILRIVFLCLIFALSAVSTTPALGAEARAAESNSSKTSETTPPKVLEGIVLTHNIGDDGKPNEGVFKDAKGWVKSKFSGEGDVCIEDAKAILKMGNDMTGIRWTGPLVRMNYEITLEAMRMEGSDFFCGLTFPYGEDPCSFIVGGWGGCTVGISSLDYQDAYNNETARFITFDLNRWYRIRVRVTEKRIEAWIDDKKVVNVSTEDRKIGIRWEVEPSLPLGVASWRTTSAIRNIRLNTFKTPPADVGEGALEEVWK